MTAIAPDETHADEKKKKPAHPPDRTREAIETIVFVVVLVLLLKLFVTEAFVIPTGSMAETLYGYQKIVTCPKCGHEFPVNSHDEVEGATDANNPAGPRRKVDLIGYTCPNCRYPGKIDDFKPNIPTNRTGDRVLVLKPIYHLKDPERGDVVVFKFPDEPQQRQVAQNYIKRAMAFGGETVAIWRGDLYVTRSLEYPESELGPGGEKLFERPADPLDLWRPKSMYANNQKATDLFEKSRAAGFPTGQGGFEIVRKGIDQLLADRRIAWDNDKQPEDLAKILGPKFKARWYARPGQEAKWNGDNNLFPRSFAHSSPDLDWIQYRHLIGGWDGVETEPHKIDNFLGYNSEVSRDRQTGAEHSRGGIETEHWVGDLILECEADLKEDGAEVVLELSKGVNRFQASFSNGAVKLASIGPGAKEFASRPCRVKGAGKSKLRFANVDCRLRVWVDDKAIDFGTDADYLPGSTVPADGGNSEGYTLENDVAAPASIGVRGKIDVRSIKLQRDIFYTKGPRDGYLFYVQPGHYLCLGDNSAQSSDSRTWGTVPERLMLGKAVFVFFPLGRLGFIK